MVPGSQDPAGLSAASRGSLPEQSLQGLEIAGLAGTQVTGPCGAAGGGAPALGWGRVWPRSIPEAQVTGQDVSPSLPSCPASALAWSQTGCHLLGSAQVFLRPLGGTRALPFGLALALSSLTRPFCSSRAVHPLQQGWIPIDAWQGPLYNWWPCRPLRGCGVSVPRLSQAQESAGYRVC